MTNEQQVTHGPGGRILTNTGVWSPDSEWLVYDTRSDAAGVVFDGTRIEMVHWQSGEVWVLFESRHGANCGVATFHPRAWKVVFIHGPERPTPDWPYCAWHRRGVILDLAGAQPRSPPPGAREVPAFPVCNLEACELVPPFTPGALRGGSHLHVWDAAGQWVSFTYEDAVLARFKEVGPDHDLNLRNVGVSVPFGPVRVKPSHPRNHEGEFFSVLVTRTTARPRPGSDDIQRACEEAWVGTNGYVRPDGRRQARALAFQGQVITADGTPISEVFLVDVPADVTRAGDGPLAGTETRLPSPPNGTVQRRLTRTAHRRHPGVQGPRHWLRSSPDGTRIAFLMNDESGIVQLWTISPNGGEPRQLTRNPWPVASAFSWSPDGRGIAHVMDNSVCVTEAATGRTTRLTARSDDATAPRPEACVFAPDGGKVAFVRRLPSSGEYHNQICVVRCAG